MATSAKQPAKNPNLQAVPEAGPSDGEPPKKKSKKKLILVVLALVALIAGGAGAAWFLLGGEPEPLAKGAKPVPKVDAGKPPVFITMEPFTVNLQPDPSAPPERPAGDYLQVSFTVQVANAEQEEIIKRYMPQVRSRLLLLLSSRRASEISTEEGKKKLADDIIAQVKQPFAPGLPPQSVTGVFFTSFVIQ